MFFFYLKHFILKYVNLWSEDMLNYMFFLTMFKM